MESSPKRRRIDSAPIAGATSMTGSEPTFQAATSSATHQMHSDGSYFDAHKLRLLSEMSQYKSNTFKLELDEMLSQLHLNQTADLTAAEYVLHRLRTVIETIPDRMGLTFEAAVEDMKKRNVHIPFPSPEPTPQVNYKFSYAKPTYMNLVGSYATKTMIKNTENLSLDLVLAMPECIFQEKDYLNYRYFHKRAFYLAVIMDGIAKDKSTKSLTLMYENMNDDYLKPVIAVSSSKDGMDNDVHSFQSTIRIHLAAPQGIFPIQKLLPRKCSLRNLQGLRNTFDNSSSDATPFYNSSLTSDATYFPYLKLLHLTSESCSAFSRACIVGRVWLRQRGFSGPISHGGFGAFEWAILMAFLLTEGGAKKRPYLSRGYSEYQLFKATLQFLANRDLRNKPFLLNGSVDVAGAGFDVPLVYDANYGVNVLFKMSPWSYELLRHEAKMTVDILSKASGTDHFDSMFLNRVDYSSFRFDASASLPMPSTASIDQFRSEGLHPRMGYLRKLYNILKTGLGDRVRLIHVSCLLGSSVSLSGNPVNATRKINIGLLFNEVNVDRKIDRGPAPSEKKQATEFRNFWGEHAELRRFPDGTITESTSWNIKSGKPPIYQQIIRCVIERHLGTGGGETVCFTEKPIAPLLPHFNDSASLFQAVHTEYETLEKDLQSLVGMPLALRHVSGTGAALRSTTVNIPFRGAVRSAGPVDVIVQFESSGRWPDNIQAIQKIKIPFLTRIADLLGQVKDGEVVCRLGLENEDHDLMNGAFLDVTYSSSITFRLRILHDREPFLLESIISNLASNHKEKQRSFQALHVYRTTFEISARHTQMIQKLCHRNPTMSPTIRLVKMWFHSHLLSSHVPDELIELFVARVYQQSYPWAMPCSPSTALFRTLNFLARWDWRFDPLIIDLTDGTMTKTELQQSSDAFREYRNKDPTMSHRAMFVVTNYDLTESLWTMMAPTKVVAGRITALAKTATAVLKGAMSNVNIADLFVPSIGEYDFILHMNKKFSIGHSDKSRFKNLAIDTVHTGQMEDDDPIQDFAKELSNLYDGVALFFWNGLSESHIGGIWTPHIATRNWKATITHSTAPIKSKENISAQFNREATLNEIVRIGGELISGIHIRE